MKLFKELCVLKHLLEIENFDISKIQETLSYNSVSNYTPSRYWIIQ